MSYNPRRSRNLFRPESAKPFPLSRSKLDLFIECPRCFYLDRRLGVGRPQGFPFNLNSAVDRLLKTEFDAYRAAGTRPPLLERYGVDASPARHENLDDWRENFRGVRVLHDETNFEVFGAIDDLWQDSSGDYVVVDYKATSKSGRITALDQDWHAGYKRQVEVYQWLLRRTGLPVSDIGYFVYCNGRSDAVAFDARLEFEVTLIAHRGDDAWVEPTLRQAHACLTADEAPPAEAQCAYCAYISAAREVS